MKIKLTRADATAYDIREEVHRRRYDIRNGTPAESITDFLGDYFPRLWTQKLATEKLDNFITGLFKFEHVNERIQLVLGDSRLPKYASKLVSLFITLNWPWNIDECVVWDPNKPLEISCL